MNLLQPKSQEIVTREKHQDSYFMFKTKRLAHILAIMYALSNDIHKDDTSFNILNWKHMVVKPKWILGNAAPQGCYFLKILVFFA